MKLVLTVSSFQKLPLQKAGKPTATIRGAATAAGVPNPDAPSMKHPNNHAIKITVHVYQNLFLKSLF